MPQSPCDLALEARRPAFGILAQGTFIQNCQGIAYCLLAQSSFVCHGAHPLLYFLVPVSFNRRRASVTLRPLRTEVFAQQTGIVRAVSATTR